MRREDNGKWILLGLFETIGVAGLSATHPQCCIFNKWFGDGGTWTQKTRIVDNNDKIVAQSDALPFELDGPNASFTAVQLFLSVPLAHEGMLWIEVLLGDEVKKRHPLQVALIKSE